MKLFAKCDTEVKVPGEEELVAECRCQRQEVGHARAARYELILENVRQGADAVEVTVKSGKGRKDRHLFIDNGGADALRSYLIVRGDAPGRFLFAGKKDGELLLGRGMTDQAIYSRIKRCAKIAGVKTLSPHDMRRTIVSDLLDNGADISIVAGMAGHSSVTTTARYDRGGDQARRRAAKSPHLPYRVAG